ncbi:MAG: hypothetical protein US63_C0015G0003 [Candidatus Moranbacteria bacterium GW2011_GWC2_37_8]|nr:MAG: hypothetical protein US63_C0015G0003 [Candidatus Moranbacteria bacterium GW2011_GWC2_37_8]KKQ62341.1 MAG: hypothetical protein US82_C0013G0011 [Parcubacteria group bacterium GW2011_GWC1_38_22]
MIKSNLEPIEDADMNLEGKLRGVGESPAENTPLANIEREIPQEISAAEKDDSYGKILSKVQGQTTDFDQSSVANDAQTGAVQIDAETQVQHLVDLAQNKGVVHAVKVAQHMQDNFVLDTFHDRMLGEALHDALVKNGMIKEI